MRALADVELAALEREGIVLLPGYFAADEIARVRETVLRIRPLSSPHAKPERRWLLTSPLYAFRKCVGGGLREELVYLSGIARDKGFREFAGRYYRQPVHLDHVMSIETPAGPDAITPWHTDANSPAEAQKPADRFTLKFFIYMNDVAESNGAFSYVPRTHRLVTALREGMFAGEIPHHWTGRFPDLNEILADRRTADWLAGKLGAETIESYRRAAAATKDGERGARDYFCEGPAGTLVIFDDRGLHRGGIPRSGVRSILRYNYLPSRYWREQFSPLRRALNAALTAFLPAPVAAHW
jgi:hypothetical protein